MNYVAGTLLLVFKNEEKAFKGLVRMLEIYRMEGLYYDNLVRLKECFYQLDRLVGILLPDIH